MHAASGGHQGGWLVAVLALLAAYITLTNVVHVIYLQSTLIELEALTAANQALLHSRLATAVAPTIHHPPRHVLFSTQRNFSRTKLFPRLLDFNARQAIRLMQHGQVAVLKFPPNAPAVRTNRFGFPFLKDMFIQAQQLVPDAATLTYFNSDLIFNQSFVDTMDAIVHAAGDRKVPPSLRTVKPRFMAVGHRTNVRWNASIVFQSPNQFDGLLDRGWEFHPSGQDYFTCSPALWDWNDIPEFVVGRVAYDNWLVDHALSRVPVVSVVDVTRTCPVIHQTGRAGNLEGHTRLGRDPQYNVKLAGGKGMNLKHGWITSSPLLSWWRKDGTVRVFRKPITKAPTRPWRRLPGEFQPEDPTSAPQISNYHP